MKSTYLTGIFLMLVAISQSQAEEVSKNPIEVGSVEWGRDLDVALATSKETDKPVLVLFQEVPGCAGCQQFGREVLTEPLLVEAIETEFIPMLVFNNRSTGEDVKWLKQYNEPAWNYQVIRFLNAEGEDLIKRKDKVWTTGAVAERMIAALEKAERPVPNYLRSVALKYDENQREVAFAQFCFWTGEHKLGAVDGVISTEAGWLEGREVTRVKYDPDVISLEKLTKIAEQAECADKVYVTNPQATETDNEQPNLGIDDLSFSNLNDAYRKAKDSDQKRQIKKWAALKSVSDINSVQLTRMNALAPSGLDEAKAWLSPRQLTALESASQ